MTVRRQWAWILVAVLTVAGWLGWSIYRDHYSPAAQARNLAHAFWTSVQVGDREAVTGMLSQDAPQTVDELLAFFHGYRYDGDALHLNAGSRMDAWRRHGLDFEVVTGLVSPEGDATSFTLGLKRDTAGSYRVWFVGQGASADPGGRVRPVLTTE